MLNSCKCRTRAGRVRTPSVRRTSAELVPALAFFVPDWCRARAGRVQETGKSQTRAGRVQVPPVPDACGAELVPDLSVFVPDWCRASAKLVPDACEKRAENVQK